MIMARKTETLGDDLIKAMGEALAHAQGERTAARVTRFEAAPAVEVRRIRKKVGLTQDAFASVLGVSASGLRKWEQKQRHPQGAALTLLQVMDREPAAVARALAPKPAERRPARPRRSTKPIPA
ncbi:MAG TPA: helix-turn-helix domain-containing protein [Bauldia sp.]|nr:helix-turn-helix domain-containing protein [Bauldia sp.]